MSKKMMKRSLALGALMAFVITGSAMAAEVFDDSSENVNAAGATKEYSSIYNVNGTAVIDVGNTGTIKVNSVSNCVGVYGNTNLIAKDMFFTAGGGSAIMTHPDSGSSPIINIDFYGDMSVDAEGHGIVANADNSQIIIDGNGTTGELRIVAKENAIATSHYAQYKDYNVMIDISGVNNVWIESEGVDEGNAAKGHAIYANSNNSTINVEASGDLTIEAVAGKNAVYANGSGSVITLDADSTTVTGTVKAQASKEGSTVNVGGNTITINGNSGNYTVSAANGVHKDGGKWVDDPRTATVNLGNVDGTTSFIKVVSDYVGIGANYNGSTVNVNAKDVLITDDTGSDVYAVYAMNGADYADTNSKDNASVNFSKDTNLTIDLYKIDDNGEKIATGNGIVGFSQAGVNIDGDVYVSAEKAVLVRGESVTNLGQSGSTVQLNGDVVFYESRNGRIDSNVNINLNGADSYLNGQIYTYTYDVVDGKAVNIEATNNKDGKVTGMNLGISDGATWTATGDSFVNEMSGNGGNIKVGMADANNVAKVQIDGFKDGSNTEDFVVGATGAVTDYIATLSENEQTTAMNSVLNAVTYGEGEEAFTDTVTTDEGLIAGAYAITRNEEGEGVSYTQAANQTNTAIGESAVALKAHWRAHMNDMNKRMGELRMANGETGVWTRMVRGEAEYEGVKAQYNQYQLGYDEKLSVDKRWTVGAAVTFSEGDSSFYKGSTEDDSAAFAIYGSKLNNDGTYVDLIARYAHLESDITSATDKSDYSTNGMSVSAEFGKRIQQGKGLWIEPQFELTYGSVDSAEYVLDGKNVQVGDMDSLIGRVGFSIGKDIEKGNVYARASYLYDFDGETETTFSANGLTDTIKDDLGGGWFEVGVGANINLSKATYIYADIEKTFGGEVDTNWQWNLGVRYSF